MVSRFALVVMTSILLSLVACGGGDPPAGPSDPDPTPPVAPSNVTVVPGPGSVTVSWEHDGVDVTGFVIRRQTVAVTAASAVRASTDVAEVGAAARSFIDDTVEEGVAYRYAVAARGSDGTVSDSTEHVGDPVVPDLEEEKPASLEFELVWEAFAGRGDVRSVAFDPSGTRLATGVLDSKAYLWDLESDEPALVLNAGSTVSAVGFTPDGAIMATGGFRLILWDAADGSELRRINIREDPGEMREWVNDLAFSPDGASVAIASDSGYVRVFNVATGAVQLAIDVAAGLEAASGLHAESHSEPQWLHIEDADGVQRLDVLGRGGTDVHTSATTRVQSLAFSPDGTKLVSGSADGGVRVWNATTGTLTRSLDGFGSNVTHVRFSPDGTTIAAAGSGASPVLVWTEATGDVAWSIDALGGGSVRAVDFAPGGERLAGVSGDGRAFVWDLVADEAALTWPAHRAANGIAFDASGTRIATVGGRKDGRAIVWAADTATELVAYLHEGGVSDVALSPDGDLVLAGADDGTVRAWNSATGAQVFVNEETFDARRIAFSPNGDRFAVADSSHINILNSATGVSELRFRTPDWMFSLAFDADGNRIASGQWDRSVHVWDAATGEAVTSIDAAHTQGQLETLAFTSDDEHVVSGIGYVSGAAEFAVWNSVSGLEVERREANSHGVFAVAFADDGALMLTGGRGSIMLWDTTTWESVGQLPIDGTAASLVVDEDVVIVGGWGMSAVLFLDRESGEQLGSVPVRSARIAFDAASGRLLVADGAMVQVWEVSMP